jgi:hypothetical protein
VHPLARADGHPSRTAVAGSLKRSTRELGRAALDRSRRSSTLLPLDLAPGGVYRAAQVTLGAGGLLHHRFTLTPVTGGGLLSVALSRGSPRVGVTDHPALRSPDLPRRARHSPARRGRPASSPAAVHQHTAQLARGLACARAGSTGCAGAARPISEPSACPSVNQAAQQAAVLAVTARLLWRGQRQR